MEKNMENEMETGACWGSSIGCKGLYSGYMGAIWGSYRDNGKYSGDHNLGFI